MPPTCRYLFLLLFPWVLYSRSNAAPALPEPSVVIHAAVLSTEGTPVAVSSLTWRVRDATQTVAFAIGTAPPARLEVGSPSGRSVLEIPFERRAVRSGAGMVGLPPGNAPFSVSQDSSALVLEAVVNGRVALVRSVDGATQPPFTFFFAAAGWAEPLAPLLHQVELVTTSLLPWSEWAALRLQEQPEANRDRIADPDGDGVTNEQEWQAGTDPLDARSALSLTDMRPLADGSVQADFATVPGKRYRLEVSGDLQTFVPQGSVFTAAGSLYQATLPAAARRFFRLRLTDP